jgi:hypothetical protein
LIFHRFKSSVSGFWVRNRIDVVAAI